jgi:hypothetical protein
MHQPILKGLEAYLAGAPGPEFAEHLDQCRPCRETVDAIARQSRLLRCLRYQGEMEPDPGFYARVLDRIDSQKQQSIWYLFLEPLFARRLLYASATLLVLLTLFLFNAGPQLPTLAEDLPPESALIDEPAPVPVTLVSGMQPAEERDVVLVQLTTYQE